MNVPNVHNRNVQSHLHFVSALCNGKMATAFSSLSSRRLLSFVRRTKHTSYSTVASLVGGIPTLEKYLAALPKNICQVGATAVYHVASCEQVHTHTQTVLSYEYD